MHRVIDIRWLALAALVAACGARVPPAAPRGVTLDCGPGAYAVAHAAEREILTVCVDAGGRREGPYERRARGTGVVLERGGYRAGELDGEWTSFDVDGQRRAQATYDGGRRHGRYRQFHADGSVFVEGQYRAGLRDGRWVDYFPDGTPMFVCHYTADRLDGPFESFRANGTLRARGTFRDGRRDGILEIFHRDGVTPYFRATYVADLADGPAQVWHENGQLAYEGTFRAGFTEGTVRRWDAQGALIEESQWHRGEKVTP
jgi:antitoxin component YwqK of YwqJK toxin-antitoxin module